MRSRKGERAWNNCISRRTAASSGRLRRGARSLRSREGRLGPLGGRTRLANAFGMPKQAKYESLVVWQRADDLFVRLHQITRQRFPADERYELTSQLRRAALSVSANIVEGSARRHHRERLQFLRTAWASLNEARYYLHVARRLGYLPEDVYAELVREVRKTAAPQQA